MQLVMVMWLDEGVMSEILQGAMAGTGGFDIGRTSPQNRADRAQYQTPPSRYPLTPAANVVHCINNTSTSPSKAFRSNTGSSVGASDFGNRVAAISKFLSLERELGLFPALVWTASVVRSAKLNSQVRVVEIVPRTFQAER